jgi:hypothetical protein
MTALALPRVAAFTRSLTLFAYNEPADTCLCRYITHFLDEWHVPTNSRHVVVDTLSNMQITTYDTVLDATDASAKRRYDAVLNAMLGNRTLPPPPK